MGWRQRFIKDSWLGVNSELKITLTHNAPSKTILENTVTLAIKDWVLSHIIFTSRCPAVTACSSCVVVGNLKDLTAILLHMTFISAFCQICPLIYAYFWNMEYNGKKYEEAIYALEETQLKIAKLDKKARYLFVITETILGVIIISALVMLIITS